MVTKPTIWPNGRFGVPQITPYTYRDGQSLLELITALRDHVVEQLHPSLQQAIDQLVADVEAEYDKAHDRYVDGIQEFQRIHDAFMADVNASLIALNDHAASDLVNDEGSMLRSALNNIFANHQDVANLQTDFEAHRHATKQAIDEVTANIDTSLGEINHELDTRLSHNQMVKDFDIRTRVNTKAMVGDTTHDRLLAALATGEPVQLDEHVDYTGNIPGFWDTNIYGTGKITLPDDETFTPDPHPLDGETIVNTIYVNGQTGSNDNDGLTPGTALHTLSGVYRTVLRRLTAQQRNGARWIIRLSGDLVDGVEYFIDLGHFPHGLVFQGDSPRNGRPVTTIRKVNTTASRPFWIEPGIDAVEFYDLHFIGWSGTYGYGVYMRFGGELTVQRCEFSDGQYGAAAVQGLTYRFNDNIVNPSIRTGFLASYNSTGQFNRNTLTGGDNSRYGIDVTRNTICHVDDNTITGYPQSGVYVDMSSRASVDRNTFSKNGVGVTVAGGAEWTNNSNTFHRDNTSAFEHHGGGREMRMHSVGAWTGNEYRIAMTNRVYGTSQRTELTGWAIIYRGNTAGRLPGQWFQSRGKYIHARIHGHTDKSGVVLELGSDLAAGSGYAAFGNVTIPDAGYFTCDIYVYSTAVAAQRTFVTVNSANGSRTTSTTSSIDFHGDRNVMMRASRGANSSAVLTTYNMQVYALG